MTTSGHKDPKRDWLFHPFEIALCGYKNSGKTTVLEFLAKNLSDDFQVGYLKHDAHRFEMDHEGKDTFRLSAAGAASVSISSGSKQAGVETLPPDPPIPDDAGEAPRNTRVPALAPYGLIGSDVLLVEGYKAAGLPRMMLLDHNGEILDDPAWNDTGPVALLGPWIAEQTGGLAAPDAYIRARKRFPSAPYFCRDDIDGIAGFIRVFWDRKRRSVPLRGLVLSGGRSERMGRDKAMLDYAGRTALDRAEDLLRGFCDSVHVSCRSDQADLRAKPGRELILDRFIDMGPLGGILSAMTGDPQAAWLVIACDLPMLDEASLRHLVDSRAPYRFATCYLDARGLPEPLCTIFEPKSIPRLMQYLGLGHDCPRKMLCGSRVRALPAPESDALANANEAADYERYRNDLVYRS